MCVRWSGHPDYIKEMYKGKKTGKNVKKMSPGIIRSALSWPGTKKKYTWEEKIMVHVSWPVHLGYYKTKAEKMYKWQNKIGKKMSKKVDPEISRGAHKLARTPKLLKKKL